MPTTFAEPGAGWTTSCEPPQRRVRIKDDPEKTELQFSNSVGSSSATTLNTSTNVMMRCAVSFFLFRLHCPHAFVCFSAFNHAFRLYRLHNLQHMSFANFTLAVISLLYAATNVVLLILNYGNHSDDDCDDPDDTAIARCGSTVSEQTFHRLEFWAAFSFTLITAFSLQFTPKAVSHIYANPIILKLVLLIQIVFALIPSLLVTLNMEVYETLSHELEYINELTIAFVDMILLASLVRLNEDDVDDLYSDETQAHQQIKAVVGSRNSDDFDTDEDVQLVHSQSMEQTNRPANFRCNAQAAFPTIACVIAGLQMIIYNSGRWIDSAEKLAHYFEFAFGIISAFVTFWYVQIEAG